MTYFQLPTGKTILVDDILSLTDEDIQNFIADDAGREINDPFFHGNADEIGFIEAPDIED
jgi:hypothetical protein